MSRPVRQNTLEKKLNKWKKVLKLGDWNIQIRYGSNDEMKDHDDVKEECAIGLLDACSHPEKIAKILISKNYFKEPNYPLVWNLDTLIVHELIHIILYDKVENLPKKTRDSKKMIEIEEHICDYFSRIIVDMFKRNKKS